MSKMIINARHATEVRVAFVDKSLYDLEIEQTDEVPTKANIYGGAIVTRIEPSLEAAFVDYGGERHGFLPFRDVSPEYYSRTPKVDHDHQKISDVLTVGQRLTVQIDKEERGSKGAAITSYISLAGSYLVLIPNNPKVGGISRRIEGEERDALRGMYNQLNIPKGMGVIIRTAGLGKKLENLQWDLDILVNHWVVIKQAADETCADNPRPFLLHQDGNVVIRSIRDNLRPDIMEVVVDDENTHGLVKKYMQQIKPDFDLSNITLYKNQEPVFSFYNVEREIEKAKQREVKLPSGGVIVIDRTEALVAIDINSSKATKASDIEQTALQTNLEASEEIARQLRIRDLGGLVVIDFIDMSDHQHQRAVEQKLKNALSFDRARIQIGKISRFGLLEMSRQRLKLPLEHKSQSICPRCNSQGFIPSIETLSQNLLRLIHQEAMNSNIIQIQLYVPVDVATFLLNEKRDEITTIEAKYKKALLIIPNPNLQSPQHHIKLLSTTRHDEHTPMPTTYSLISPKNFKTPKKQEDEKQTGDEKTAIVGHYLKNAEPMKKSGDGILNKIRNIFSGNKAAENTQKKSPPKNTHHNRTRGGKPSRSRQEYNRNKPGSRKKYAEKPSNSNASRNTQTRHRHPDKSAQQSTKGSDGG